jgi:hypothetical protein
VHANNHPHCGMLIEQDHRTNAREHQDGAWNGQRERTVRVKETAYKWRHNRLQHATWHDHETRHQCGNAQRSLQVDRQDGGKAQHRAERHQDD